jgi:hypothetical protein
MRGHEPHQHLFREVHLKGPRIIFKGNPQNYLTEIRMLIEGNEMKKGADNEAATA